VYNHGNMTHTHAGDSTTATNLLQGAGLRLTPQRLAIAHEVLAQDHPTAAEVYDAVRVQFPTMGLATVYATLNVMVERGLLRPLAFENAVRFDANVTPHANLICTACGRITDYDGCDDVVRALRDRAAHDEGFELEEHRLDLYGRCAPCSGADGARTGHSVTV
jgi:Fur family transcriptional regulator, peroxide stress response regulator